MFTVSILAQAVNAINEINAKAKATEPTMTLKNCVEQIQAMNEANRSRVTQAPKDEKMEAIVKAVSAIDSNLAGTIRFHGNTEILASFLEMRKTQQRNEVRAMRIA